MTRAPQRKRKPKRRHLSLVPPQPQNKSEFPRAFNVTELLDGLSDPAWVICEGDTSDGLNNGDLLLIDRGNKTPRKGEIVLLNEPDSGEFMISVMRGHSHIRDALEPQREIYGTVVYTVRRLLPGAPPWEITA